MMPKGGGDLIKGCLELLRVKHWIKNFLCFFPLVFSGEACKGESLLLGTIAFVSFSFMSSAVYVINDLRDIEADRVHPKKRNRPLASGVVSIPVAIILAIGCFSGSLLLVMLFARGATISLIWLGSYFLLNIGYSFGLKNIPILDIGILATGFILRVLFGGAVCGIPISGWLFLTILALAFFFAFGKRRGELLQHGSNMRKSLETYSLAFLDKNLYVFLSLGLVFYSLWTFGRIGGFSANIDTASVTFILGIPLVMLACLKYSLDIESNDCDGDPVEVILADKSLFLYVLAWAIDMFVSLYIFQ